MSYFVTQDKTNIFYRDLGQGAPVILIHGWPLNSDMWEYQTTALLEAGHRVITYDRRGFGKSGQPATGYDYDTLASDLNDLIGFLELQKVSLIGFSMGGGEVARYLSRFGTEKIWKVGLISSVVPFLLKDDTNPEGVPSEKLEDMKQGLRADRPHFLSGFAKQFYGDGLLMSKVSKEICDWTAYMAYAGAPWATIQCVDSFGRTDFRPDLPAFKIPTLIVHGSDDKTVPIAVSGEAAARMIPGATLKVYDSAPHGLFITHKDDLCSDLVSFFGSAEHEMVLALPRPEEFDNSTTQIERSI